MHIYDIKNVCIHPACVISVLMTNLRNEVGLKNNCGGHFLDIYFPLGDLMRDWTVVKSNYLGIFTKNRVYYTSS